VYTPPTKVTWATGDEITVIVNDTDANKFTNSEGNYFETTEFIPEAGTEYTYHAFYPYSSFVTSVDEAGKTDTWISVPSSASASQNGLNSTAHVQGVLYGDGTATGTDAPVIDMKHLTALLKIDVTNNYSEAITLRSITVSTNAAGQYLSGRFDVNLNDGTLTPNSEQVDRCVSSSTLGISDGILEAGATASFYLSTTEFTVPVGSTLTISAESDKGTAEDVRTYPQEMVFAAGTVNNTTFSFENPEQTIEKLTVAEFLAKPTGATYYELTGTISNISDTEYGNFDLVDETGSVYVYGLTASKVASNDKSFSTLGLREGDILTLYGTRAAYKGDPQVGGPAYYISHVAVPYCDVTPSTLSVDAAAGETTFSIESNESWSIESDNSSYTVSPASGNGDAEITVTYPANEGAEPVEVVFTVLSNSGVEKTVTLTQRTASAEESALAVLVTSASEIVAGKYIILGEFSEGVYALPNAAASSSAPVEVEISAAGIVEDNGTLTAINNDYVWQFTASGNGFTINPVDDSTIGLGCIDHNNGLRNSSSYANVAWSFATSAKTGWEISSNDTAGNKRWICGYQATNWRTYKSATTNANCTFRIYKLSE
ncbi:MAG TPA: hypothetical protein IAC09_07220, partial [Candidatus Cryptobacteroides intestinipullorum]|nr:hypothetical protein [Candidatus Cryptobacteroides intestinipullorum]